MFSQDECGQLFPTGGPAQTNKNLLAFIEMINNQQIIKAQLERKQEEDAEQVQQQEWSCSIHN